MLSRLRHTPLRMLCTLQRRILPFRARPTQGAGQGSFGRPFLFASALTATAFCATRSETHAEADATSRSITWPGVINELHRHQQTHDLPPFTAQRRTSQKGQCFTVTLRCAPSASPYPLLTALVRDLLGGSATFSMDDTATRCVFTLSGGGYEVAVSVPRVSPFESCITVEFLKSQGEENVFSTEEVEALLRAYCLSRGSVDVDVKGFDGGRRLGDGVLLDGKDSVDIGPRTVINRGAEDGVGFDYEGRGGERARKKLEEMGVEVFMGNESDLSWESLAGYDEVKERIENTLTLPLKHPEIYESIVRGTRERFESNLPKACLFEGLPGTGKTLSAKILASIVGVPFVHVPLETILSKFYGETTRKLADILQTANKLGKCLVFIDECDSIGLSRSSGTEVHEVTRRTLSVLLRHIDGLEGAQNTILLAATNHKEDIDPALMSRFDVVVSFPLPDLKTRKKVLALYAKHLSEDELRKIAEMSGGFSGRELLDVCEEAERSYAGFVVREGEKGKLVNGELLPKVEEYFAAIERKKPHVVGREKGNETVRPTMAM